ncbi:uncharacterized protein LODBEIA_P23310 [Lodderomyces beijingensis]|uniref:Uncharacterized protein n=1 Tax=Lodderomyces beijingensis TaxID=1775926 RepID=A0ABP0ZL56_9ASCO
MTSEIIEISDDDSTLDSETDLRTLVAQQQQHKSGNEIDTTEQDEFNNSSKDGKLARLNNLIEKSQVYSRIIADNILQTTLANQKNASAAAAKEEEPNEALPQRKKRRVAGAKRDIASMLSADISENTRATREKIEKSQVQHNTNQPRIVSGGVMKDYQLDGLEWLVTLYQNGLNGILADEMGLGKTLQCIAFLGFLIENGIKGPFLVVVPLSTLANWYNEVQKFAPKINVLKYQGLRQDRAKINLKTTRANVIITTYEISIRDFSKFNSINWAYLIVDEGHRLKNSQCLLIKVLKKLNTTNRLLITGTPLQNNLNELWSLLNFILPDIFHDLELFQQWFNFDEMTRFEENEEDEETRNFIKFNIQETLIKNLHTILKPFILRRLKRDVIKDLPPKKEYLIHIPLSRLQKKIYLDALNDDLQRGLIESNIKEFIQYNHVDLFAGFDIDAYLKSKRNSKKEIIGKRSTKVTDKTYIEADSEDEFEISDESMDSQDDEDEKSLPTYEQALAQIPQLQRKSEKQKLLLSSLYNKITTHIKHLKLRALKLIQLRNICNSPYLYYEPFPLNGNHDDQFMEILLANSCKFQALEQIVIPLITSGHKCLIFSQFTKVMDLIQDWLSHIDIEVCRLDGSTQHEEREEQISLFNNPKSPIQVFLLSTRAGGLGINLTAADTVILFDNDWNPQMDLQAIDRIHRIGQTKPVKIFRFVVRDSIEEILISRSSSKRFLEKLVIQMGEFKFNKIKNMIGGGSGEENDEMGVKELLELSKHNFKYIHGGGGEEQQRDRKHSGDELRLTRRELDELLDRSDECYRNTDDSRFKNVTIFETINNMDK